MASNILIIGVVHHQPQGAAGLAAVLNDSGFDPKNTIVGVEASALSLSFRRAWGPELKTHLEHCLAVLAREQGRAVAELRSDGRVVDLLRFLEPPFEFTVARIWAGPGRVRLTGSKAHSRRELAHVWEMFSLANLRVLLQGPPPRQVDVHLLARKALAGEMPLPKVDRAAERKAAALIRRWAGSGPAIHIGGWAHLPGLKSKLADLNPALVLAGVDGLSRDIGWWGIN